VTKLRKTLRTLNDIFNGRSNNSFNASGNISTFIDNLDAIPDTFRRVNSGVRLLLLMGGVIYMIADDEPFSVDEVDGKVRILKLPLPEYRKEARDNHIQGIVLLRVVCSSSGKVSDVEVLQGLPHGLSENAVQAMYNLEFQPAVKNGRFVSQYIKIGYGFSLKNEKAVHLSLRNTDKVK
jgi:TonB family protein